MTERYKWETRLREASDQLEYSLSDEEIKKGKELINELINKEEYNNSSYRLSSRRRREWATAIAKMLIRKRGIPIEMENKEIGVNAKLRFLPINPVIRAKNYLDYIVEDLGLNDETKKKAKNVLDRIEDMNKYMSGSPLSTLGGVIYLATSLNGEVGATQQEVANAANVSEVAVRNRYKDLKKNLNIS